MNTDERKRGPAADDPLEPGDWLTEAILALQERSFFWVWDEPRGEVRWMTSFDTTADDVQAFVASLREVLG